MNRPEHGPRRVRQDAEAREGGAVTQVGGDQHVHHHYPEGGGGGPRVPVSLPAAPAHLVGRAQEAEGLLELLEPADRGTTAVVVSAVHGLGGIGKTALALHTAHEAVARGWFGGALFVGMHGYTDPVSAGQAVEILLRALGVPEADLPPTAEEQVGLYQAELARRAGAEQRMLLLIDDVSSPDQVRPLIPARGAHRMLVTTRDTLTGLDARLTAVDELSADAAAALIADVVLRARPQDRRPAAEGAALAELAALCGRLPLALQIAAAVLVGDPGLPIAALAADLADERTRLDRLRPPESGPAGGAGGDAAPVRAAFALSYQRLPADLQRLFGLLSIDPGPEIGTEAAAVLAGEPADHVRPVLGALSRAALVTEARPGSARWRMHDLIALYAAERAGDLDEADRERALDRLLEHYDTTTGAADEYLSRLPAGPLPDRFQDRNDALAWLDTERANLVAAVGQAAATHPRTALSLTAALREYLHWRRHFDDALTIGHHAVATAREVGDRRGEGRALNNLGIALREVRRFEEAIENLTRAAAIYREVGDRHGEGTALNNLGNALREVRRFEEAIDACTRAAAIFGEVGDRHGEGMALNNLGLALQEVRRFEEAIENLTRAAAIYREVGDRYGEGQALNNLGNALREVRRFEEAIHACTRAAAIFGEVGDRHGEGTALNNLGSVLREVRRFEEAIDACTRAAAIFGEVGDRHGEGTALNNLGSVLREVRRFEEAIDACTRAAAIFGEVGDRHGEGTALNNLGLALREVRRFEEAIENLTRAAAIYREVGDRYGEGQALNNLGNALQEVRRFEEAIENLTRAAAIYREVGDRYGEGMALNNLGNALREVRRFEEAIENLTRAAAIFGEVGDRYGEGRVLNNLGLALGEVRRFEEAIHACTRAAAIFGEVGDRHGEGRVLNNLGSALRKVRRFEEAIENLTRAAAIYREVGDRYGEGTALNNLGNALQEVRRFEEAIENLTRAAAIYREVGDRYGEGTALNNLGLVRSGMEGRGRVPRRWGAAAALGITFIALFGLLWWVTSS